MPNATTLEAAPIAGFLFVPTQQLVSPSLPFVICLHLFLLTHQHCTAPRRGVILSHSYPPLLHHALLRPSIPHRLSTIMAKDLEMTDVAAADAAKPNPKADAKEVKDPTPPVEKPTPAELLASGKSSTLNLSSL